MTAGTLSLDVSWTRVTDADGYKVQWKSGTESFGTARQQVITSGSTTTTTIPNLTAGTLYTVRVIATKSGADDGPASSEETGTPLGIITPPVPPAQVTGVTVTPGTLSLSVSWTRVTDADGYKVQWKSGTESFGTARQQVITSGSTNYNHHSQPHGRHSVHGEGDSYEVRRR